MTTKILPLFGIAMLLLTATLLAFGGSPSTYAEPEFGQGCQCHNNGIALWFNETGFNEFPGVSVAAGATFVLNATSANYAASGVVPGVQQWLMNATDTAKFTIIPQNVSLKSSLNISPIKVNSTITALYKITVPKTGGNYLLSFYAEGTTNEVSVQVKGSTTTTTTGSSGTNTSTGSTQTGSSTTNTSTGSTGSTNSSTTTTTKTSTSTKATKAVPDVTYYSSELALVVIGFSIFLAVALLRYRKS